jgi:dTDP-4-dehydrorhamnose reductase
MTRILLIGGDGMLGSALNHVIERELLQAKLTVLRRRDFDIERGHWRDLPIARIDWVLNAAGIINRRDATAHALWTVNAVFPRALAVLCAEWGTRLVHFSTDCVFDGSFGPYDESHPGTAADPYGLSKIYGEPPSAMTLRTSIVGPERSRFYNLLCWALRQHRINGFRNRLWNGVTTVALARGVVRLIQAGLYVQGVRHVYAEDTTKHELLRLICRCFAHGAELHPADAPVPRDTRLATNHPDFLAVLGLPPRERQLAELPSLATREGAWQTP